MLMNAWTNCPKSNGPISARKGDWSKQKIIQYTENWYGKSGYGVMGPYVKFDAEYSYGHLPKLIGLTPLDAAVFKLTDEK